MATAAANCSTFPLFSNLALELRHQIWRDALPDEVGPALYFYKMGCWHPRRLSESDEGYDPENDENNLNFEFRHDLLDAVGFEIPLASVNREAQGIVLAWARKQSLEIRPRGDGLSPLFVRPFDPMRDALYIEPDRWVDFLCEPDDRLTRPDLIDKLVDIKSDVVCVAVPETLVRNEAATLRDMFQNFLRLEVLVIIVDAPPDLQSTDNDMKVQRRWEPESIRGSALFWNDGRGDFDRGDCERIDGDETLYKLLDEARRWISEGLARNDIRSFEIRPAFAIGRR